MFFIKRSQIVVDCFTCVDYVYKYNPIETSAKLMPDWIKTMSATYKVNGFIPAATIKKCPSVVQLMSSGFIIPLWTDLAIKPTTLDNSFRWQFADEKSKAIYHSSMQWGEFADPKQNSHMKIISPWHIKTKEDVNFVWMFPFFNNDVQLNYHIAPAIIDFKHQHSSHINMFIDTNKNEDFIISAGTPMVQLIPMSDKKVIIKNHLVDVEEYDKYTSPTVHFLNNYQRRKKSKCPFSKK